MGICHITGAGVVNIKGRAAFAICRHRVKISFLAVYVLS